MSFQRTGRSHRQGKGEAPSDSLAEFWNHRDWSRVFRSVEHRGTLRLLAVESVKSRGEFLELLELLGRAAKKHDPEYKLNDTRKVQEILIALSCVYEVKHDASRDEDYVASGNPRLLDALHAPALEALRTAKSGPLLKAARATGAKVRRQAEWGQEIADCLDRAARKGFAGQKLARAIYKDPIWFATPRALRYVTIRRIVDVEGERRSLKDAGDLTHLSWDRFSARKAREYKHQRPLAAALDRWCALNDLEASRDADYYRELAYSLLKALGVPQQRARNVIYAVLDNQTTRTKRDEISTRRGTARKRRSSTKRARKLRR
jgi:hypothetical protein